MFFLGGHAHFEKQLGKGEVEPTWIKQKELYFYVTCGVDEYVGTGLEDTENSDKSTMRNRPGWFFS